MNQILSFILPVYNVEAYLPECVESIRSQMDDRCEMILVDDGSLDSSGALCDRYAAEDPRIRVIHKENGGLSSARNAGMDAARGEYITFVDADDYIEKDTVKLLLEWICQEKGDICFLGIRRVYPDGGSSTVNDGLERAYLRGQNRNTVLRYLSSRPMYPGSACAKLLRRELLREHHIHFPYDRRISEDLMFCLELYLHADRFDCLEFPFYCYRQKREGSITNTISIRYYLDSFLFTQEVAQRFAEDRTSPEGMLALSAGAYEYAIRVWDAGKMPREDRDRAWELLKQYRWILAYGQSRKVRFVRLVVSVLGLRNTSRLMDFYQKHRR